MKSLKIGMLGFGVVGSGVVHALQQNADLIEQRLGCKLELSKVVVRNLSTKRGAELSAEALTTDVEEVLSDPQIDIVVELIGGYEPAKSYILRAIAQGKHVITANKALMAVHGQEIVAAADKQGVAVMFEAAVAGGIPVISAIKENLCVNRFSKVQGILNGTCNYILTKMTEEGGDFAPILAEAQALGYAEADPTFDVEGIDTAHKIALLSALCFGTKVDFDQVYTEGISSIDAIDIDFATQMGYRIKLLAVGKNHGDQIEVRVHPTMIPESHQLAEVDGVFNAVRIKGDFVGPVMFYGQGAGMKATASAVMGDVLAVARDLESGARSRSPIMGYRSEAISALPIRAMSDIHSNYYLRFTTVDQPGVLSQIAGCLGRHNISIQSMIQPEPHAHDSVPIVLMTHEAQEANVAAALIEIDQLEVITKTTRLIRVENDPA
jgi:homoserine dehydrogenase